MRTFLRPKRGLGFPMPMQFPFVCCLVLGLCLGVVRISYAQGPQWWTTRGVLTNSAVTNDYAPANAGQLKHMAWQAYYEMQAMIVGGAGENVSNMVYSLPSDDNYVPVNIGQLKHIAHPFYAKLITIGYTNAYPWGGDPSTNDYALLNIGQIKSVFSFDPGLDTDNDTMPDWWENLYAGLDPNDSSDADEDMDNDGLINSREYQYGAVPNTLDTDVDGLEDGEDTESSDLYVWNHTAQLGYANSVVAYPVFSAIHHHPAGKMAVGYDLQVSDDTNFTQLTWSAAGGDQVERPWSRIWGGSGYYWEFARRLGLTSNGSIYVAMDAESSWDGQTNAGSWDFTLCLYDARGERTWTRMYGSSARENTQGIVQNESQNCLYIVGRTWGDLGGTNAGSADACLIKYSMDGERLWVRQWGTNIEEQILGGEVNSQGDVFVAYITGNAMSKDLCLRKYTSGGTEVWTVQVATNIYQSYVYPWGGVTIDGQDQLFVSCSEMTNDMTFACRILVSKRNADGSEAWTSVVSTGTAASFRSAVMTPQDELVLDLVNDDGECLVKVSTSDGEEEWLVSVPENVFSLTQLTSDGDGNIYASGNVEDPENSSTFDPFAMKMNSDGEVLWTHIWGSNNDDQAAGIAVDQWGAVYVVGATRSAFDGESNPWASSSDYKAFLTRLLQTGGALPISSCADGARSSDIQYGGPPLEDVSTNFWRIRFADSSGLLGDWSTGDNWFVFQADTDDDGLPDWWEFQYFGGSTNAVPTVDSDGDGLTNLQEYQFETNPTVADTDGDGMIDGDEVAQGFDPITANDIAQIWIYFPENGRQIP